MTSSGRRNLRTPRSRVLDLRMPHSRVLDLRTPRSRVLGFALFLVSCAASDSQPKNSRAFVPPALQGAPAAAWSRSETLREKTKGAYYIPTAVPAGATAFPPLTDGTKTFIADGIRITLDNDGTIHASKDRFAQLPKVVPLGAHLGGGYLFVAGPVVWRAEGWLDDAKPLFISPFDVALVYEGMDRVYVRSANGAMSAFDAQTGSSLELSGFPRAPSVSSLVALDRYRSVALVDLLGVVHTEDAGKTWTNVAPPFDAQGIVRSPEGAVIVGREFGQNARSVRYLLTRDGTLSLLSSGNEPAAPVPAPASSATATPRTPTGLSSRTESLVLEGYPLGDGTFVHAALGDLVRYDASTLREISRAKHAFPETRATCHSLSLPGKGDDAAFGFVCNEPNGGSTLYDYESGTLQKRVSYDTPREIRPSGSDIVTVHGSCTHSRLSASAADDSKYCIVPRKGMPREIDIRGAIDQSRLVPLKDGRIVVLSPPHGILGHARLSILERGASKTIPLVFGKDPARVTAILEHGLWLDGWEERDAGVIGGWVESRGTMVGVSVSTQTGIVTVGTPLGEALSYSLGGRFAFAFAGSRRGFETIDGGLHWDQVTTPDREGGGASPLRGCTPVGCVGKGFIRLGWGEAKGPSMPLPPSLASGQGRTTRAAGLSLGCEIASRVSVPRAGDEESQERIRAPIHFGGARPGRVGATHSGGDLPAFWSSPPPPLSKDSMTAHGDSFELLGAGRNLGLIGRAYAWGPKGLDWDRGVSWNVYWLSPFESSKTSSSAKASSLPTSIQDWLRPATLRSGANPNWTFAIDDPDHALFTIRSYVNGRFESTVFTAETGHAPAQITRVDGEPFGQILQAVRMGARWVVLQVNTQVQEHPGVHVLVVEGTSARVLSRLPRVSGGFAGGTLRLGTSERERTVGIVVEGSGSSAQRWVLPIAMDSGEVLDPEPLGLVDFTDRSSVPGCDSAFGYRIDLPMNGTIALGSSGLSLFNVIARMHVSSKGACIQALSGNFNQTAADLWKPHAIGEVKSATENSSTTFTVSAQVDGTRQLLRCKSLR